MIKYGNNHSHTFTGENKDLLFMNCAVGAHIKVLHEVVVALFFYFFNYSKIVKPQYTYPQYTKITKPIKFSNLKYIKSNVNPRLTCVSQLTILI